MRRLPSLRGLQAFEAIARTGNLSAAADSLAITPSAVSHRLRGLEDELGVQLLHRTSKGLVLTDAGHRYRRCVEDAFGLLARGTADLLGPDLSRPLTVSLTSSMGVRWLMPRFHRFRAQYPEIEIAVLSTGRLANLSTSEADLALRYGHGGWPGLKSEPILRFTVSPLCAPRLMEPLSGRPLHRALAGCTVLDVTNDDWEAWIQAAGAGEVEPARRLRFNDFSMALSAAIDGQGVILGYSGFVEAEIAAGLLIQPFELTVAVPKAYYLVYSEDRLADARVRAFRDWILAESHSPIGARA